MRKNYAPLFHSLASESAIDGKASNRIYGEQTAQTLVIITLTGA